MTDPKSRDDAASEFEVTITKTEYEELLAGARILEALRMQGVDNWEGFEFALDALEQGDDQ